MTDSMPDTAKPKHRTLRFNSLDELLAEADRCAHAAQRGSLRTSGNWSLATTLNHLAAWVHFGFDGVPKPPPVFLRWLGPVLLKKRMIRGPMPRGVRIPGVPGGTFAIEDSAPDLALAKLRTAIERLKASTPAKPNPLLGPLTRDEWIALQLRHAELHLGYLHPKDPG